jgi:hypothetical protein
MVQCIPGEDLTSGWDLAKCAWDPTEWLERLTANAEVATGQGSIPASSDTVESEGVADKAVLKKVHKKTKKNLFKYAKSGIFS